MIVLKESFFHGSMNLFVLLLQRNKSYSVYQHGWQESPSLKAHADGSPGLQNHIHAGARSTKASFLLPYRHLQSIGIRCPSLVNSIRFLPVFGFRRVIIIRGYGGFLVPNLQPEVGCQMVFDQYHRTRTSFLPRCWRFARQVYFPTSLSVSSSSKYR